MESFKNFYEFNDEELKQVLTYYREYFKEKGMLENVVYNGIDNMLETLKNNGKRLFVATSKPEPFAISILDHFRLSKYFEFIAGSNMNGTRAKKNEVIDYCLENCKYYDKSKVIMIGDREHDVIGANKCDVDSIGVLFGYGSR